MKIFVNSATVLLSAERVTYEQIIALAGNQRVIEDDHGGLVVVPDRALRGALLARPLITYHVQLPGDVERSGEMYAGCEPVRLDDGMVFTIQRTGNA